MSPHPISLFYPPPSVAFWISNSDRRKSKRPFSGRPTRHPPFPHYYHHHPHPHSRAFHPPTTSTLFDSHVAQTAFCRIITITPPPTLTPVTSITGKQGYPHPRKKFSRSPQFLPPAHASNSNSCHPWMHESGRFAAPIRKCQHANFNFCIRDCASRGGATMWEKGKG